jgi:hypothetical protein
MREAGRPTRAIRLTFNPKVTCPAGDPVYESPEGSGVRCAIERNTLSALRDPSSLLTFCLSRYDSCPTWELEKRRVADRIARELADDRSDQIERPPLPAAVSLGGETEVTYFEGD